jgi:predicted nucleic acid-binding protein
MTMRKLKLYLDTSVLNFVYADDAPDLKRVTVDFFERYASEYLLFISRVVVEEIAETPDPERRQRLLDLIPRHAIAETVVPDEVELAWLAGEYLKRGIIPASKMNDALHVAYAVLTEMDVLLSWNFKHLANIRKEARILAANIELGYRYPLRIVSPMGVEDERT